MPRPARSPRGPTYRRPGNHRCPNVERGGSRGRARTCSGPAVYWDQVSHQPRVPWVTVSSGTGGSDTSWHWSKRALGRPRPRDPAWARRSRPATQPAKPCARRPFASRIPARAPESLPQHPQCHTGECAAPRDRRFFPAGVAGPSIQQVSNSVQGPGDPETPPVEGWMQHHGRRRVPAASLQNGRKKSIAQVSGPGPRKLGTGPIQPSLAAPSRHEPIKAPASSPSVCSTGRVLPGT